MFIYFSIVYCFKVIFVRFLLCVEESNIKIYFCFVIEFYITLLYGGNRYAKNNLIT